jgi:23S rRNA (pseudouridine1915-N3)-methyltransferase
MRITILCVGKIKESFFRDGVAEYAKRLSRYCRFEVVEVPDEMTPEDAGDAIRKQILEKEGARLLSKIRDGAWVCTLEIKGKRLTSEAFAEQIRQVTLGGVSDIIFVIGGSLGLSEEVTKRADYHLSFSDMTFPHQLMRVILCEQIYRAFRIIQGEPYHK